MFFPEYIVEHIMTRFFVFPWKKDKISTLEKLDNKKISDKQYFFLAI